MVAVNWEDAWYVEYDDDDVEPLPLTRIGFVIVHNARGIKLAHEVPTGARGASRHISFIPAGNILSITTLK